MLRRAVFLDRDGVLAAETGEYISSPDALTLIEGASAAVSRLCAANWLVAVVSNQAGVGKGCLSLSDLQSVNDRLCRQIELAGGRILEVLCCPHHPEEGCDCRKPRPGLLLEVAAKHSLDLGASWMVGDSPRDIAAGCAAGVSTLLVLTGHTRRYDRAAFPDPQPDAVFADLAAASEFLCTI